MSGGNCCTTGSGSGDKDSVRPDSVDAPLANAPWNGRQKLVYMHEALHLEAKLHDAGWEPDIERHESDTDSQASDDEVDFRKGGSLSKEKVLALCM